MTEENHVRQVTRLAKALDAENYSVAERYLTPSCTYEIRGTIIQGRDAIIDSYRSNGNSETNRFDAVIFKSSVTLLDNRRARIDYTDIVTHLGDTHTHRCAQIATCDQTGKITHLLHIDLPGERESLESFKNSHPARDK